jgi:hypothetical protein
MSAFLKTWWGKSIAALLVLFLLGAFIVGFYIWRLRQIFPDNVKFDSILWKTSSTDGQDTPRCLMQKDLEQNHLKLGVTRAEVSALLGDPGGDKNTQTYDLGFCGFSIDGVALKLEFTNNKLSKIYTLEY